MLKFKKRVLKNGLTILFEKRNLPVASIAVAVRAGGINETLEEKGIFHFIEHMLYKGTKKRDSKKIAEDIEKNGGILNGFTSENVTAYLCKVPDKKIDIALDVLGDMIENSVFNIKDIEKEKQVIFEEIKMHKDTPQRYVIDEVHKCLYKNPFGTDIIGTFESVGRLNRKKLISVFNSVYSPKNLVLVVVGNVDFEKIVRFAEKTFKNKNGRLGIQKIQMQNCSKIEKRKGIDQANMVFAYHVPLFWEKNSYASKILNTLMAEGASSRLFNEIREKRNLVYAIVGDTEITDKFAYTFIYAGTKKENVEKVKKLIIEEFEKVAKQLTDKELKQIKEQIIGNYRLSMEDSQDQVLSLLIYEMNGNAKEFYDFEEKIRKVKLNDVKELAKKAAKNYSFFALIPE